MEPGAVQPVPDPPFGLDSAPELSRALRSEIARAIVEVRGRFGKARPSRVELRSVYLDIDACLVELRLEDKAGSAPSTRALWIPSDLLFPARPAGRSRVCCGPAKLGS
jgi:hypothetical protein